MTPGKDEKKEVLLIGGSGFIGNALGEKLSRKGWSIRLLTRNQTKFQTAYPCHSYRWDGFSIPEDAVRGVSAIVNLAGESIAEGRWSQKRKKQILDSRVHTTKAMVDVIKKYDLKLDAVIQSSAVGFYGMEDQNKICDESSRAGQDFLSSVCQKWEAELKGLNDSHRLCVARIGLVLDWQGGALEKLWDIYVSGVGCTLSDGKQWMNWIHMDDLVNFYVQALENKKYQGVYNLVAPENLSNKDFHRTLCRVTPSFAKLFAPSFSVKLLLGGKGDLVLKGPHVKPKRLEESPFEFEFN